MHNKQIWIALTLLAFLLLPAMAWATSVPEVTEAEYRYFLEKWAPEYLDETDYTQYSDKALHTLFVEAVTAKEGDYAEFLRFALADAYVLDAADADHYSVDELEQFAARSIADDCYEETASCLSDEYQIQVDVKTTSPQELESLYWRTALQQDFAVTEDLSDDAWYQLEDRYRRMQAEQELREDYGVTEDLSGYTTDELRDKVYRLYLETDLRGNYGVTEDLSDYTDDELEEMSYRLCLEVELREDYDVTEDLSGYTDEELEEMSYRFSLEADLRENGVTDDLSSYTTEELEEWSDALWEESWEATWEQEIAEGRKRVQVQINGEPLRCLDADDLIFLPPTDKYTSDVAPVMREERVYIPFRAVFEALGATVSYDAAGKKVTAQRDGRTVSFVAGQAQYTTNDVTVQMDAQPFVQDGRTFVPVRFASQALGAAVGWDADTRTAIIVDRAKLLQKYQGKFTVLDRYVQHWNQIAGHNLAVKGDMQMQLHFRGEDVGGKPVEIPLQMNATLTELTAVDRVNMDAAVTLEIDSLRKLLQQQNALNPVAEQLMQTLKQFRLSYIADLREGNLYVKSELLDLLQGEKSTWYRISVQDYLGAEEYQIFLSELQQSLQEDHAATMDEALHQLITNLPLTDSNTVREMLQTYELLYRFTADTSLGKTDEGYSHQIGSAAEGGVFRLTFLGDAQQINGMRMTGEVDLHTAQLQFSMEEADFALNYSVKGLIGDKTDQVQLDCSGTLTYASTEEEPLSKPQSGESVRSFENLLNEWLSDLREEAAA